MNRLKLPWLRVVLPSLLPLYEQRSLHSLRSFSLTGSTSVWSGVPLSDQFCERPKLQPAHQSHLFATHTRQHAQRKPYRHPGIFTKEIVEARQAAVWRVRSASSAQVTEVAGQFSQKMLKLCDSSDLDYIHVSTMNHSTAAVWIASDAALTSDLQQQQQCRQDAQRCLEKILPILEAMLTRVGPRQASNTLWSFAKLGLDPDAVCPGITAHLLHKVAEITKAVDAQAVANSVWAMAALQDVRQASNAEKSVTNRLCHQFMKCVGERGSATAQGVCSVLHGSFALDLKVELSTLDKRFAHLVSLVQHAPAQVVAQDVSNSLLYCYKLRYMPQPAQASALLAHFVSLFSVLGKEPDAQDMSNTALALAGLDVPHAAQELQSIASRIVNIPGVNSQELCNLAWSMALSNVLDHKGFDLILHILEVRMKNVVTTRNLSQLHLALDHLEPLSKTSNEYAAWVCVKDKLGNNVGYAPTSTAPSGSNTLHAILDLLGVRHRRHLQLSTYVVDAGLERIDDKEAPAVLVVTASERAHLINAPKSLMGSAKFKHSLLTKHGQVVVIPHYKLSREGVKAELEAAIGVPLHQAFGISANHSTGEALNRQPQHGADGSQGSSRTKLAQQKAALVAQPA